MSWHFDKDNHCTYKEWIDKSGGLLKSLDDYLSTRDISVVLEFGTGNSTRVLSKRCLKVITVDSNSDSIIVPVMEQGPAGLAREFWSGLKKEENVDFICGDILKLDFQVFKGLSLDMILFDVGITEDDKYLYRILYERLKANQILTDKIVLFIDNYSMCSHFMDFLKTEGYTIIFNETDQAIAKRGEK
jgi:hypothetical protein